MKKIYLLSLFCILSVAAIAQTTIQIYPAGGVGTYNTGNCDGTTRTDDNIVSTTGGKEGYAVFDLTAIPAGALVTSVSINFNVSGITVGTPSGWNTYGYVGDLSAVVSAPLLYSDMTSGTNISTATYGTAIGNQTIATTPAITNFVASNVNGKVSICLTGGGLCTYTITGESGTATTTGVHQPYLNVTYCSKPKITVVSATPNPVCVGSNLTLSETASITGAGSLTYAWSGPGGYTSLVPTPTFSASLTSAGTYTVTATHTCGAVTDTAIGMTASVVVNPVPSAIIGASVVCVSSTTALTDTTILPSVGAWSSSLIGRASVSSSGVVSGASAGVVTITYKLTTGCYTTEAMTVYAPPTAITAAVPAFCQNQFDLLTESATTGTWSSSSTVASVDMTGNVFGSGHGAVTISYTVPGCAPATIPLTVNQVPPPFTGGPNICLGSAPVTLTDGLAGGTWTSTNTTAKVVTAFGVTKITGFVVGTDTVIYTITTTGCADSGTINVVTGADPITGPSKVCVNSIISLTDLSGVGTWTSQDGSIASLVNPSIGDVTGVSGTLTGSAVNITYTMSTSCYATKTVTVYAQPSAIIAPTTTICSNDSVMLSDSDPAGFWTSAMTTVATVGSGTGMVNGVSGGTDSVYYTFSSTGCYNSVIMNINPAPDGTITTTGPTTFCSGGTVTLSVPLGPIGTTYQWYSNGISISGANTNSYTTDSTQTLTVQIENSYGCVTTSAPQLIISGLTPSVDSNGSAHFCLGNNVILTAKTGSGTVGVITYQWRRNLVNIASANANNYVANTTGLYDCVVTVSGGSGSCSATTTDVDVLVNPAPTPSVTYIKTEAGTKFTASVGYKGYQWFINTVSIPGAIFSTYTAPINGSYRVLVTDSNGCSGYSGEFIINNVGVAQVNNNPEVKIYPNPASSMLHIEASVNVHAVITSIEGKILLDNANAKDINISNLANGLYMVILYDDNGERLTVEKLIKQ